MTNDELDRLCAGKIMGWFWSPDETDHYADGYWLLTNHGIQSTLNKQINSKDWQPTRNISQAWEVLAKAQADLKFSFSIIKNSGQVLEVQISTQARNIYSSWDGTENAETNAGPLAIIKACLKANGVEVE